MFKKNKEEINIYQDKARILYNEWGDSLRFLKSKVMEIYLKVESLKVYPDGEYKKCELEKIEKGKQELLTLIKDYENKRDKLNTFINEHKDTVNYCEQDTVAEYIIMSALENIFKVYIFK